MRLKGRVAIVTGGARGIGGAIAWRFTSEGALVMIADIDTDAAQENLERIASVGGQAQFTPTDVSDAEHVERLFEAAHKAFGRLDILVNNAGVVHGPAAVRHFLETPEAMWNRLIAIHLNGLFYCSQRAARIMVKQGQGGCIINMSSSGATRAHRQMMAYDTTKGGIEAATRATALDLAPWKIRVNAVVPGAIAVENRAAIGQETVVEPGDVIPLGHLGTSDDVANAALFLASDEAAYVTGHCLVVDGGLTAQLRSPMVDMSPDPTLPSRI
jgi:NAD(P)-dependent dehydrogenase (short-subunit alcohol dehydrogenase family)